MLIEDIPVKTGKLGEKIPNAVVFERLSPAPTRTSLLSLKFAVGDVLRSNHHNPMFEVIEDTVGTYNLLTEQLMTKAISWQIDFSTRLGGG